MSVINQVLKDLNHQGARTATPDGVVAVNKHKVAARRSPLIALIAMTVLAAGWWQWPLLKPWISHLTMPSAPSLPTHLPTPARPPVSLAAAPTVQSSPPTTLEPTVEPDRPSPPKNPDEIRPQHVSLKKARIPAPKSLYISEVTAPQPKVAADLIIKEIKSPGTQVQAEDAWQQALRAQEQGRNHDAKKWLEKTLQLDPAHLGAHQNLIALLLETGASTENSERAEALLRQGLTLHAGDPWYPRSLAQLFMQRGDFTEAAILLKTNLNNHSDADNWSLYAGTLTKLGKPAEAAQAYREALRLTPTQGNWWIGLAVALEQTGEKLHAAAAYQRALRTRLSAELREFALQKTKELNAH